MERWLTTALVADLVNKSVGWEWIERTREREPKTLEMKLNPPWARDRRGNGAEMRERERGGTDDKLTTKHATVFSFRSGTDYFEGGWVPRAMLWAR